MKLPARLVRTYRDLHTWTGIVAGFALFIAFFAGAVAMFEDALAAWSMPAEAAPATHTLADVDATVQALIDQGRLPPQFTAHVDTWPAAPAPVTWHAGDGSAWQARLDAAGELQVGPAQPSELGQWIDDLHRTAGVPGDPEIGTWLMGVVSALYFLALVSGVIVFLPALGKDLLNLRIGRNLKRTWLDVHNLLGVASLPFHLVIALSAVVFAFHDDIYSLQDLAVDGHDAIEMQAPMGPTQAPIGTRLALPSEVVAATAALVPQARALSLDYRASGPAVSSSEDRASVRINVLDDQRLQRDGNRGVGVFDAYNRDWLVTGYLPGHGEGWFGGINAFFALHFGNYGGAPVRWGYVLLGLAGAFVFYTGNLVWIETRRRRQRRDQALPVQRRDTWWLAAATVGVCIGSMLGVALTLLAAHWLPWWTTDLRAGHQWAYYAGFLAAVAVALRLGAARSAPLLLWATAATCAAIALVGGLHLAGLPVSALRQTPEGGWIVITMVLVAVALAWAGARARRRAREGGADSVWSATHDGTGAAAVATVESR